MRSSDPASMNMTEVPLKVDLDDGEWHHVAVQWSMGGNLFVVVNAQERFNMPVDYVDASLSKM